MSHTFESYTPPRISKSKLYLPGGKYSNYLGHNILCKHCGQPRGQHFNKICPNKEQRKRHYKRITT